MQAIKQFFKTHPHAWWGFYLPVYLAAFFIIEHFITDNYWATQTVLDSYVPFCEWLIFPYVSWSPLLVVLGVYLILNPGADAPGFTVRQIHFTDVDISGKSNISHGAMAGGRRSKVMGAPDSGWQKDR